MRSLFLSVCFASIYRIAFQLTLRAQAEPNRFQGRAQGFERRSDLWREPHHDVKLRSQFTNARTGHRSERNDDRIFCFGIVNSIKNSVSFVPRLAFDVALRGEFLVAARFDRKMDVRGATGIGDWLYCAEQILAS